MGSSGSRIGGLLLAVALLLALTAVPVIANAAGGASGPADLKVPSSQDVAEGIAQAEKEEAEAQSARETPGAIEQREESQTAFGELSSGDAEQLLRESFTDQIESLNSDPARFLSDATSHRTAPRRTPSATPSGSR